ncbi:MAG: WD40 repeat domain-containing protein [Epsilonproteobacteria bacterium]|nr:WD40 repeat domain-containing protein [Campylobacterota bacterium]
MKFFCLFFIIVATVFATEIKHNNELSADGEIINLLIKDGNIYATTDISVVDVFDMKSKKIVKRIKFSKVKDFFGDLSDVRIFSVDKLEDKLLFASQGTKGFSRVYLYYDDQLHKLFDENDKMAIMKVKFIDKDTIVFALLSSEVILYNLKDKKVIYDKQVSGSKFSDFQLNKDKTKMLLSDESGSGKLVDIKNGNVIKKFEGQNLDNTYQVDYKSGVIAIASKDRRCGIYKEDGSLAYHKESNFLVYSVGLSPSGKLCAYPSDNKNTISIFDVDSRENQYKLVNIESPVSNIVFLDDDHIVTSNNNKIKFWSLK